MAEDYRITVTIDREMNQRLDAKLQWGMKTQLIRVALGMLADFVDKHGNVGVALILDNEMELRAKEKRVKTRRSGADSKRDESR